jgi:hypothetical protein
MRPYNSGPTLRKLGTTVSPITDKAPARHIIASTVPWINWMSIVVVVVAVTCYPGFILRHRFLKPPARTQTPLAARRIRWCTWQCLDIAVGSVLRLAECPSGHGLACGERSLPVCRMPAKSLASVARQSDPCTHALSLSTLELSVRRFDQDLLTTTPHMHDGRQVSASFGPMVRNQDATSVR